MSRVPTPINLDSLEDNIKESLDTDYRIEKPNGEKTKPPESVLSSLRTEGVAHAIAEHISEVSVRYDSIKSTNHDYGSGDTGRQSVVNIYPEEDVEKSEMRDMGKNLDIILDNIFPTDYLIGIKDDFKINEEGHPEETSEFSLFLAYQVKSTGQPQRPPGESTELI